MIVLVITWILHTLQFNGSCVTKRVTDPPVKWMMIRQVEMIDQIYSPKSLQMVTATMKLKDAYSLEGKLWPT